MKLKHTPAPWRLDRNFPGRVVAGETKETLFGKSVRSVCRLEGRLLPDYKANLLLITAAPDLFEALGALVACVNSAPRFLEPSGMPVVAKVRQRTLQLAEAAIHKATNLTP